MADYDGRVSDDCKQECQAGTCAEGDPDGCGSCCGCRGGCYAGYMEQVAEEQAESREGWTYVGDLRRGWEER